MIYLILNRYDLLDTGPTFILGFPPKPQKKGRKGGEINVSKLSEENKVFIADFIISIKRLPL